MPEIRLADVTDYPAIAGVLSACDPRHPQGPDLILHLDSLEDPRVYRNRYVFEEGGRVLGYAGYFQFSMMYDPRRFVLSGGVLPEARGRGIGAQLLDRIMADLTPRGPRDVGTSVWDYQQEGLRFLEKRGYVEIMREVESRIDLTRFDSTAFEAPPRGGPIRLAHLGELDDGPALREAIFRLDMDVSEDIPMTGELTRPDFGVYHHLHFELPGFRPELCWLALDLDSNELVGLSWHQEEQAAGRLGNIVSGVRREYRRRGIALALKGRALADARARGYRMAETRNEESNVGMLAVNRRLGFTPCGAFIILQKELAE